MLKIALPNGSLQEETLAMLDSVGLHFSFENRCYVSEILEPFPIRATLMRPQHIPQPHLASRPPHHAIAERSAEYGTPGIHSVMAEPTA